MNIAAKVREAKRLRPDDYCSDPQCLWRTRTRNGYKACPKHATREEKLREHNPETCEHPHCQLAF